MHDCCIRVTAILDYFKWAETAGLYVIAQGMWFSMPPLYLDNAIKKTGSIIY